MLYILNNKSRKFWFWLFELSLPKTEPQIYTTVTCGGHPFRTCRRSQFPPCCPRPASPTAKAQQGGEGSSPPHGSPAHLGAYALLVDGGKLTPNSSLLLRLHFHWRKRWGSEPHPSKPSKISRHDTVIFSFKLQTPRNFPSDHKLMNMLLFLCIF